MLLTSLTTMLQMELPQVNVLSKIDLAQQYGKLQFGLNYYTEVLDLSHLLETLNMDVFMKKYSKLNASLVDVIESYSLVSFVPMTVSDKKTIASVAAAVDKANGYIFGSVEERNVYALFSSAIGAQFQDEFNGIVGEKYLGEEESDDSDDCTNMSIQ